MLLKKKESLKHPLNKGTQRLSYKKKKNRFTKMRSTFERTENFYSTILQLTKSDNSLLAYSTKKMSKLSEQT